MSCERCDCEPCQCGDPAPDDDMWLVAIGNAIDDELGWDSDADREAGNYLSRIIQAAGQIRDLKAEVEQLKCGKDGAPADFNCELCKAGFAHPGSQSDCGSINGACEHLVTAGWVPVWVAIELDGLRVTARGGWLCRDCCSRHGVRFRPGMGLTRS